MMKVAVIGAGKMGAAFATALAQDAAQVMIGLRHPQRAQALAGQLGHGMRGGTIAEAVMHADIVIMAVPCSSYPAVLQAAGDVAGKILVDVSNPGEGDLHGPAVPPLASAAQQLRQLAPAAKVVKAFNTIFAELFDQSARKGRRLQVFIAGDDMFANLKISELAARLDFDPLFSGPLSNSRFLESIGQMNLQFRYGLNGAAAIAPSWIHL